MNDSIDIDRTVRSKKSLCFVFMCVVSFTLSRFQLISPDYLKESAKDYQYSVVEHQNESLSSSSELPYNRGVQHQHNNKIHNNHSSSQLRIPKSKHHSAMGFHLLHDAIRYVNDPTMRLSPYVDRPWLHYHFGVFPDEASREAAKPRRKLVLTDFGWNNPDVGKGLEFPRVVRSREILQAYLDHPDFDPTFMWNDMLEGKVELDPEVQHVAMLDVETCFEANYPGYYKKFSGNNDQHGGRTIKGANVQPCYHIPGCSFIKQALHTPFFQNNTNSKLLYIECRGDGPPPHFRKEQNSSQLVLVSISSEPKKLLLEAPGTDMGLPPPAVNPVTLPHKLRQAILDGSCSTESPEHRPYLMSFVGSVRHSWRTELYKVHNGKDVISLATADFKNQVRDGKVNETFHELMTKSVFSAAPRGDNRFSYRFTEVLSSGAIPVVHSDGWVYPFRPELFDWRECVVILPESTMNQTHEILKQISVDQRCRMRRKCLEVYQKYCANPEGTIAGILDSLDAVAEARGENR